MSTMGQINESALPDGPERRDRAARWPMFIVGMLLLNVGVCVVTIVAAATHPVTVEPDYYDKALRWDELRELPEVAESARLMVTPATEAEGYDFSVSMPDLTELHPVSLYAVASREAEGGGWGPETPLIVEPDESGTYRMADALPEPGVWLITATVRLDDGAEPFRLTTVVRTR